MVNVTIACPHCGEEKRVRRHGRTRQGSERLYCVVCRRAFTPQPKSRALTTEKEAMIGRALLEKTPLIGICRTFKVSPNTIYKLLKKT
jgi:transposase-like protein